MDLGVMMEIWADWKTAVNNWIILIWIGKAKTNLKIKQEHRWPRYWLDYSRLGYEMYNNDKFIISKFILIINNNNNNILDL